MTRIEKGKMPSTEGDEYFTYLLWFGGSEPGPCTMSTGPFWAWLVVS